MMRTTAMILAAFSIFLGAAQSAQVRKQAATSGAAAKIEDFAWIAGSWRTTAAEDVLEETWNPPLGNQMLGMFQWQKDGKIWLNELVSITQGEDGKFAFRLRHFGPDMTAWEDKDKPLHYPLRSVKPGEAIFENPQHDQPRRFIYTQSSKDALTVRIEGYKDGEPTKTEFSFTRK